MGQTWRATWHTLSASRNITVTVDGVTTTTDWPGLNQQVFNLLYSCAQGIARSNIDNHIKSTIGNEHDRGKYLLHKEYDPEELANNPARTAAPSLPPASATGERQSARNAARVAEKGARSYAEDVFLPPLERLPEKPGREFYPMVRLKLGGKLTTPKCYGR